MSAKKQTQSLSKLHSIYEEVSEGFFDETDVDNSFYHNTCDISQPHHCIFQISKSSKKEQICHGIFPILRYKNSATIYSQRRNILNQGRKSCPTRQLARFPKSLRPSQQILKDSSTVTQKRNWLLITERKRPCSLLKINSKTFH